MARSGIVALGTTGLGGGRSRRVGARWTLVLVLLGPLFAAATAWALAGASRGEVSAEIVRAVLLADLVYILAIMALIIWTIAKAVAARRRRSAGSKLHLRLAGTFTLVALAPTICVAVFATLTVNFGMEAWFSTQVGGVVRNALSVAEAYETEHKGTIRGDALAMANDLNRAASIGISSAELGQLVRQQQLLRELPEAYVLDGDGQIVARGEFSYLFTLERPTPEQFAEARRGEVVVIDDEGANELRALVHLSGMIDRFLYITRRIEGEVLLLLDETRETVRLYERLEEERHRVLFDFALLYLGFAALVILAAVWLGLWFAERLAKPIGRLAAAAERVGEGNYEQRVKEERGDDEVALLGRVFNRMTAKVKSQRDALVAAAEETDRRRRFIETVLSGVSAGVIGLDGAGRVELVNAAAGDMLDLGRAASGRPLAASAPGLGALLDRARHAPSGAAQEQLRLVVGGREREFLVRVTPKAAEAEEEGWVLTLDDMTDLVAAQRMAAWGDVARRIAHEIKNPLTPIQLSAERLKRKFSKLGEEERAALGQYADVIVRQAGDIRRMVDEFSKFARMPAPETREEDVADILRAAVLLQRAAEDGIERRLEIDDGVPSCRVDRGLLSQGLTNLLKNAAEAVQARLETRPEPPGEIRVALRARPEGVEIEIADNGVGLPSGDRDRLVEPYVTTRAKGTGLGLAFVKKIAEEHGGALSLDDAAPFAEGAPIGARATVFLPAAPAAVFIERTPEPV